MEDAYLAYIHLKRFDYERVKSAADKILVKKPGDTFAVLLQMQAVIESSYEGFDETELQEGELGDLATEEWAGVDLSMPTSLATTSAMSRAGSAFVRPLTAAAGRPGLRTASRLGTGRPGSRLATARLGTRSGTRIGTRLGTSLKQNNSTGGLTYLGGSVRLDDSYASRPVFRRLLPQYWLRPRPSGLISQDSVPDPRNALTCLKNYGTPDWFYNDRLSRVYQLLQQNQEAARHLLAATQFLPRQETFLRLLNIQLIILNERERNLSTSDKKEGKKFSDKVQEQVQDQVYAGLQVGNSSQDFSGPLKAVKSISGPRGVILRRYLEWSAQFGNSEAFLLSAGRLALFLGENVAATSLFSAVLRLDSGNLEALQSLASLSDFWPQKQALLERVKSSRPEDPTVWNNLGVAAASDGRYGEAFQCFVTALRRFNTGKKGKIQGKTGRAAAQWRHDVEKDQQSSAFNLVVAECENVFNAVGEVETANQGHNIAKSFSNTVYAETSPRGRWNMASVLYNVACLFQQVGDLQAARDSLELVLLLNNDDSDALTNLGALCHRTGQKAKAERLFQRAVEIDPRNIVAARNARLLALRRGDIQAAAQISAAAAGTTGNLGDLETLL